MIEIDMHEFGCLIECCYNSMTGVRHGVQEKAILSYNKLDKIQRDTLWHWIKKLDEPKYDISARLKARYDPNNQYRVTVEYKGNQEFMDMYLFKDRYWNNLYQFASEETIINVEKI